MIDELKGIIESDKFKVMLNNPELWESKDIDYCPPRVERCYMPWNNRRLSLHVIYPCDSQPLIHPHAWRSAIYVTGAGGKYEHGIGVRGIEDDGHMDIILCKQIVTGEMYYEMLQPSGVHYVKPIGLPIYSIMLSGKVIWKENDIKSPTPLSPLLEERKKEILLTFKSLLK